VQRVDLQDVVKAAVASVRHSADAKGIRLQAVLDPLAGPVRGDPNRLQQCFWNLLNNAIKFTPKGGKVQVSLGAREQPPRGLRHRQRAGDQARVPAPRVRALPPGRRLDHAPPRRAGAGAVDRQAPGRAARRHGARQEPRRRPGRHVLHRAAADGRHVTRLDRLDYPSLEGITVLAVDDEPDARTLIRRVLEQCGARVLLAASASEGLESVRRDRPHMIISDIGMPVEDGYTFIQQVRRLPPDQGGRTPAAALTAFARAEDRTRALRAGYQTHVAKPVEPMELTAVVASLATRP
jgi:CheY-like chemotaxis protein